MALGCKVDAQVFCKWAVEFEVGDVRLSFRIGLVSILRTHIDTA
jgi:hypothetical protein